MSEVEYREIGGYPGYRVGNDGSVWTGWVTCRWGRIRSGRWKQLKPGTHRKGYHYVNLTPVEGKYKTFRVHRLILEAFIGPCPEGMECRHLNDIKTDNRLDNLAWGTGEENRNDIRAAGSYEIGQDHSQAKLTDDEVREIRRRHAAGGVLQKVLAADFGVNVPTISGIVNRRTWKHLD